MRKEYGRKKKEAVVVEDKPDRKLIPILTDSGRIALHDEATGDFVTYSDNAAIKYEPFDPLKAEAVVECLGRGVPLPESLKTVGVSLSSFMRWESTRTEFKAMLNSARINRSMWMHEKFYTEDMSSMDLMTKDIHMRDSDGLKNLNSALKALEKKQKIINRFQEKDAPTRFGDRVSLTEKHAEVALKINMELPEQFKKMVDKGFKAKLDEDGEFITEGIEKNDLVE